ncbi:transporter substrate-binding domain-containing protein [Treponema primitia]|uniref:transporter substrate-binding domain-containing protein n=1 Tax=Treponema primitia TaxID=88058 RepID=UPI00025552C1|nr:transporter substrate-binding domain-containing protein [Treponema primitia]
MKKMIALGVIFTLAVMSLAAGAKQETSTNVVNIAGDGATKPFQWTEANGQMVGYDIDVANEVAKRAGLTLKWEQTEFPALFLGLDANKYQVIVNNLSKTEARAAKYIYSDNYYIRNKTVIVARLGRTDIHTIDDLVGKNVPITPRGNTQSLYLEAYNKEHPNAKINLVVSEAQPTEQINGVFTGQFDAAVTEYIIANEVIRATGAEFTIVELPEDLQEAIAPTKSYFLFSQSSKALQEKWDAALATLITDGTLKDLSIKYFGSDFSR